MFRTFRLPIAAILLCVQVISLCPVAGAQTVNDAFAYLQQRGVIQEARPNDALSRMEALKVVLDLRPDTQERVQWYRQHLSSIPLFRDIDQRAWYAPYVEAGFEAGILTGYPDRTLRPTARLQAEEAIALLLRAYDIRPVAAQGQGWYEPYVQEALERNLVAGDQQLWVGYGLSRAQFFDMAYRMDIVATEQLVAFDDPSASQNAAQRILLPSQQPRPEKVVAAPSQVGVSGGFSISIPNLGIENLNVSHPADALTSKGQLAVLQHGVGHLFSYPGTGGKVMIYGHSSGYSWDVSKFTKIFTKVNELRAGDLVYVTYNGSQYTYQVTRQETIAPNDIRPFTGRGEELILYTCWPVGTAKSRLIVRATPVAQVAQQ